MASLVGRVYAITGGASGIGLATAKRLAERGGTVCIADIDPEAGKSAFAHFAQTDKPFMVDTVDVSKRNQVELWLKGIVDNFGRLDGAANVAGIINEGNLTATIADLKDEEWDRIIAVNLTGTMYCLRAELGLIEEGGSIVNMASIHGLRRE